MSVRAASCILASLCMLAVTIGAFAQSGQTNPGLDNMIVTIVTFKLPTAKSLDEATEIFKSTAPKYQTVKGLLRKNYWISEDGREAGGIYVWSSRQDADNLYTSDWKKFVEGKYGAPPAIRYVNSPVMIDNFARTITVDAR
jgi:hypothetical protein